MALLMWAVNLCASLTCASMEILSHTTSNTSPYVPRNIRCRHTWLTSLIMIMTEPVCSFVRRAWHLSGGRVQVVGCCISSGQMALQCRQLPGCRYLQVLIWIMNALGASSLGHALVPIWQVCW